MGYRRWTRGKRVQDKRREGWRQEERQGHLLATVRGAGCSYRNCVRSLAEDVIKVQQHIIRPLHTDTRGHLPSPAASMVL
jgi:hypothetical protein